FSFFFSATAPSEIYTLSLHDALPICRTYDVSVAERRISHGSHRAPCRFLFDVVQRGAARGMTNKLVLGAPQTANCTSGPVTPHRSEEHTSELQSRGHLVCRLLLEKKK